MRTGRHVRRYVLEVNHVSAKLRLTAIHPSQVIVFQAVNRRRQDPTRQRLVPAAPFAASVTATAPALVLAAVESKIAVRSAVQGLMEPCRLETA